MTKEIIFKNHRIYYRISGSGPLVMLLHGFGEDGEIWNGQVDFLKDSFRIIVPDLPGSGKSELIEDMSMEGMAEVIREIIDVETSPKPRPKEGASNLSMVGHSMGGYIALAFAEKYPSYLNALGLFHSTAWADSEEKKATREKGIAFIEQHGGFEFLRTTIPNLFSQKTREEKPGIPARLLDSLHNFSDASLVSYYRAMMQRPDRTAILKKQALPMLFVIGEQDNAVPMTDSLQQCHLPEKSYIHILSESGHMGMLEEADKTNWLLSNFLKNELKHLA